MDIHHASLENFDINWDRSYTKYSYIVHNKLGKILLSHREGIITMIPKAGQLNTLKGWRPITLMNVDFKIISSAISARIQKVVEKLTGPCQTAYII